MSLYRDTGIVLRVHKLGEADRIITLLTRERGLVRAVAKGVRKTTSRFGGRLEPFMHVDLQLAEGRSLDIITQAETINAFARDLGSDYAAYTAGTAMLETAERLVQEDGEPAVAQLQLLTGALRALTEHRMTPGLILDSYQLRALSIAGYAPTFDGCARCGEEGPHRNFHAASGGMLCDGCRVTGSAAPSPFTVTLLAGLLSGDWATVGTSDDRSRREASSIINAYLSWHLERGLRSLSHVDR
ncbi:DNA repair protein RecO [Aeromicrobium sp. SMF47]|uniref:DNA repair protein RecO n=1 Tax=Aeromicrobium yanjiei TaxID=2662028 RepID=A0A5Q2MCT5_9ACTN|nr:DNA repair protein RecO [Aeromicrobium yanjiei]MRJ78012.1 DNA repair protein RecO [Aeromicrobium yanjiei]QGG40907.1 DNA repair protein RecO [Aeromicrobium yanjiei]